MKSSLRLTLLLTIFVFCIQVLSVTAVSGWPIKDQRGLVAFRTFVVGDVISSSPGKEVVTITTDKSLIIFSHNGTKLLEFSLDSQIQSPTLADFNHDGLLEIVASSSGQLHVIQDGVDSVIYSGDDLYIYRPIVVDDLNGDGELEIAYITFGAKLYVRDRLGNLLPGWPQQPFAPTGYPQILHSPIAVGDLDKDGTKEIVVQIFNSPEWVVTGAPTVFAFNLDGTTKWQTTVSPDYINYAQSSSDTLWFNDIVLGDVDFDGFLEVVYFRQGEYIDSASGSLYVFDHHGEIQNEWSIPYIFPDLTFSSTMAQIALGDLDSDTDLEIVVAGRSFSDSDVAAIFAWHHNSQMVDGFPATVPEIMGSTDKIEAPMIADADGEGTQDIISSLYSRRNNYYNRVYAWDSQGQLLAKWPKELIRTFYLDPPSTVTLSPWNQTTIVDLDNNGTLDLIATIGSCEAHAIDLTGTEYASWPMFRHDFGRTGRYEFNELAHLYNLYLPIVNKN